MIPQQGRSSLKPPVASIAMRRVLLASMPWTGRASWRLHSRETVPGAVVCRALRSCCLQSTACVAIHISKHQCALRDSAQWTSRRLDAHTQTILGLASCQRPSFISHDSHNHRGMGRTLRRRLYVQAQSGANNNASVAATGSQARAAPAAATATQQLEGVQQAGQSSRQALSSFKPDGNGDGQAGGQTYLTGAPMQSVGYGSAPPPQPGDLPLWAHEPLPTPVPPHRRIYCNRALNMHQIKAIGWDMDYTLAQYRPETFESLAHQQTVDKLVTVFGYPEVLRSFTFSWDYMMKGLILDKERGNVLKVDRHKYVKLAYHGFQPLTADTRKATYNTNYQGLNFDSDEFALIDTLFSLAEAYLYCQLVELKDSHEGASLAHKSYKQLYKDLRTAVDMCHRDGSLKKAVAANPEKYIHKDPLLAHMLVTARAAGRRLFLATNSLWDYTNVVMNYLLLGKTGAAKTTEWLKYFDVVMVGCGKPGFFGSHGQLFHVDVKSGLLSNTDNGAPILPVDDADMADMPSADQPSLDLPPLPDEPGAQNGPQQFAQVFQGGCYKDVHRMLGVTSGDQVLYVGDHIYGDIVKAKKEIGWRTMLVVPELQLELQLQEETKAVQAELRLLRQERDALEDQIQRYEWAFTQGMLPAHGTPERAKNLAMLDELRARQTSLKERHGSELSRLHARYHPIWGQILKTGYQNSRFAHQIERFACLYTSHVSNLSYVSPDKKWQGRLDYMAHEDVGLGDGL